MVKIIVSLLLAVNLHLLAAAQTANRTTIEPPRSLALKNVTVVDVKNGKLRRGQTVLIGDNRIVATGKSGAFKIPLDAEVVDAAGKFLIPGLWDMHVHFWDADVFYPIALANGITGIRDMGDDLDTLAAYRKRIESGELIAPRLVFGGQIVDGLRRDGLPFLFDFAAAPEAARESVRKRKAANADFVKVYSHLAPDVYAALIDEAKKQNLSFAGHVPYAVGARAAARAGQSSIEHLTGFAVAAASDEAARVAETEKLLGEMRQIDGERARSTGDAAKELAKKSYDLAKRLYEINEQEAFDFYDAQKGAQLIRLYKRANSAQVPTLAVIGGNATRDDAATRRRELLGYFPNLVRGIILQDGEPSPAELAKMKRRFQTKLRIVGQMRRDGIRLLVGTDAPNGNVYPGFSLHDELAFLVQAGLTPLEALRAATLAPAEFLGKQRELGAIEPNKLADLVLLDANPLADIRNTAKIRAVIVNGRLLTRAALDKMLSDAKQKNAAKPAASPTATSSDFQHEH